MCAAVSNTLLLAHAGITIRNGRLAGWCVWGDGGGGQSQVMERSLAKVSVAASSRGREIDHCPLNVTSGQTAASKYQNIETRHSIRYYLSLNVGGGGWEANSARICRWSLERAAQITMLVIWLDLRCKNFAHRIWILVCDKMRLGGGGRSETVEAAYWEPSSILSGNSKLESVREMLHVIHWNVTLSVSIHVKNKYVDAFSFHLANRKWSI